MAEIGRRGWVALTHNKDIRYNPRERDMVMRARVPLFMLIGKYPHDILARNLVNTIPSVLHFLEKRKAPFIAKIYKAPEIEFDAGKPGPVNLSLSYKEWRRM